MEKPVTFENENGDKLFGIVHIPEKSIFEKERVGINLLNPGIKYRVAPNRLNVKLARKLCDDGYYVLRFDPAGIGDSEGELPHGILVPDMWEKIQTGLFVPDTIAANNYFIKKYEVKKLILMGSCGGAITSLLTSSYDSSVDALCLIDIPINLRTSRMSYADKIAVGGQRADLLFSKYAKKLIRPQSWYRFITLKTEYRALRKIVSMKLRKIVSSFRHDYKLPKDIEDLCYENNLNRQFFESFEAFYQNGKATLFILAEHDKGTEIFQTYFLDIYLKHKGRHHTHDKLIEAFLIQNANHTYTFTECQESLLHKISTWVETH